MKVEKHNFGTLHRVALCQQCDWEESFGGGAGGNTVESVARNARRHAEQTGHTVVVESGSTFQYQVAE